MNNDIYGYIRVSSISQDHAIQKTKIMDFADYRKLNILRIFEDKASGANAERSGYLELYDALKTNPDRVRAVVVTKLDRLGRSLRDIIEFSHWLDAHGIGLIVLESNIDTTTSEGRLFFHFMASIAEYERERIAERTADGRVAAQEKGVVFGRHKIPISVSEIERMKIIGIPLAEIARRLKVSRGTIYQRLKEKDATETKDVV